MNLILMSFVATNLLFMTFFVLGRCFIFKEDKNPNLRAHYAAFLGALLVLYFISIITVIAASAFHHSYLPIGLVAFIIAPFIIGNKARYEKLSFYSNVQLAMFFISLLASYILIKF